MGRGKTLSEKAYDSYVMRHPDGGFMCYCSKKRANWYVERGLASWMEEGSTEFVLKFVPGGVGKRGIPFYEEALENRCVVCGADGELNKHHVVPAAFRRLMPLRFKKSNHHDVLAICLDCHEEYERHASAFKKELADEALRKSVSSSEFAETEREKTTWAIASGAIKARKTLERAEKSGMKIPEDRLAELRRMAAAAPVESRKFEGSSPSEMIMGAIADEEELRRFIRDWRRHFVKFAKPMFLPKFWSVEHCLETSEKEVANGG